MGIIWIFVKKFWPELVIGFVVLCILGYISVLKLERDHYKKQLAKVTAEYEEYKEINQKKQNLLKEENNEITKKYAETSKETFKQIEHNYTLVQQGIKDAKELRDVKLSIRTIQLFNLTTRDTTQQESPLSKQRDVGETKSPKDPLTRDSSVEDRKSHDLEVAGSRNSEDNSESPAPATLQDLLLVTAENNSNHLKCIKQVIDWQNFWQDYTKALERAEAIASP